MKKINIFGLFAVLLIVVFAGCTAPETILDEKIDNLSNIITDDSTTNDLENNLLPSNANQIKNEELDSETKSDTNISPNPTKSEEINTELTSLQDCFNLSESNEFEKDYCFMNYAINSKNEEICENVSDLLNKQICVSQISTDPNTCNEFDDIDNELSMGMEKDWCLLSMAIRTNNIELCPTTKSDILITCKATINNDVEQCTKIEDLFFKDVCVITVAIENNSPQTCELMSTPEQKTQCIMILNGEEFQADMADGEETLVTEQTGTDGINGELILKEPPSYILE
ncbi:MAG: hypothetical protein KAS30_00070 [Candidatus Diapherotrites archaeon]|nr:hypothetical protein [Candidatus Diapherotrites archaeon]